MNGVFAAEEVFSDGSVESALEALQQKAKEAHIAHGVIKRFFVSIAPVDVMTWIEAQSESNSFYWSSREGQLEVSGVGVAHEVRGHSLKDEGFKKLVASLRGTEEIRYFGCARFDEQRPSDFPGFRFVLPFIELTRHKDQFILACHLASDMANSFETIRGKGISGTKELLFAYDDQLPSFRDWNRSVSSLLASIHVREIEKVVLAQRKSFACGAEINPFMLLERLKKAAPAAYHFCMRFGTKHAFVGASPEQLYARDGLRIDTEAQAGTRPRGNNAEQDQKWEKELLASAKDSLEHELVRQEIAQVLERLCRDHGVRDDRKVVKLPNVQHLRSRLSGILHDFVDDAEILSLLHPTPAVCGLSREGALNKIREHESFDRSYYAGPVGYLGGSRSEFAVGIRSALIEENRLHLFAGAGIVAGSKAEDEWQEVANKMSLFAGILAG